MATEPGPCSARHRAAKVVCRPLCERPPKLRLAPGTSTASRFCGRRCGKRRPTTSCAETQASKQRTRAENQVKIGGGVARARLLPESWWARRLGTVAGGVKGQGPKPPYRVSRRTQGDTNAVAGCGRLEIGKEVVEQPCIVLDLAGSAQWAVRAVKSGDPQRPKLRPYRDFMPPRRVGLKAWGREEGRGAGVGGQHLPSRDRRAGIAARAERGLGAGGGALDPRWLRATWERINKPRRTLRFVAGGAQGPNTDGRWRVGWRRVAVLTRKCAGGWGAEGAQQDQRSDNPRAKGTPAHWCQLTGPTWE